MFSQAWPRFYHEILHRGAFAEQVFAGNQAGVCLVDQGLSQELMQSIAAENNLAETAFISQHADGYGLRWFTPEVEIDLCGHATLASAYVVFNFVGREAGLVVFQTQSGPLTVARQVDLLEMDFPSRPPEPVSVTALGTDCDFVSRFFAPKVDSQAPEDPVTGSTHCSLIPFWSARLGRKKLLARQLSKRGGCLYCEDHGRRVKIAGRAALYLSFIR